MIERNHSLILDHIEIIYESESSKEKPLHNNQCQFIG